MNVSDETQTRTSLGAEVRLAASVPPPDIARQIRINARVTVTELAVELGVHRSTLTRWEYGNTVPIRKNQIRYAAALTSLTRALGVES